MIGEKWSPLLHRIQGNGCIATSAAGAAKGIGVTAVSVRVTLSSNQVAVGGTSPKVSSAGLKKGTGQNAERSDQLARVATLKSSMGQLQEEFLEGFVRLRRAAGTRISGGGCQCSPIP